MIQDSREMHADASTYANEPAHVENHADGQVYELGYHIVPTVAADDLEGEVGTLRNAIEKRGGSFIAEGTPETVTLAYPMFVNNGGKQTKYERAYFGWMKFELDPEQAVELRDEDLASNTHVLRYTLFKTTREETRAQLQTEQSTILREVKTTGILEKKHIEEEGGEVSEEALEKSIDELVGEEK
jgi:ribosomal protein S6